MDRRESIQNRSDWILDQLRTERELEQQKWRNRREQERIRVPAYARRKKSKTV
jgi:metal-responsive CopG/Arc/MetJ family transcriptional regulator